MTIELGFTPRPPKKKKRSQTAPLIASIVTPAVVMIGFLIYLDQKGFFSAPKQPTAVAAKIEHKPRIEKDSKHFPAPAKLPRADVPPWGPLDNPKPKQPAEPIEREPIEPFRPADPKATGPVFPTEWDIELPSGEPLRSRDVRLSKSQVADPLGKHPAVWVFVDRDEPAACFPLGTRKSRRPGLREPVFEGVALAVGDTRHPTLAVEYDQHKRSGWFRQLNKQGDTELLIDFTNGMQRGISAVLDAGRVVYLRDVQDNGKTINEYFVTVDGELVQAVPVDRKDAKQVELAGNFHRQLIEALADLDAREGEWRRAFTRWDNRCEAEITAAATTGGKKAGEAKIADLKKEQDRLRDLLLGGR